MLSSCFHAFWCFPWPILAIFHITNVFLVGYVQTAHSAAGLLDIIIAINNHKHTALMTTGIAIIIIHNMNRKHNFGNNKDNSARVGSIIDLA